MTTDKSAKPSTAIAIRILKSATCPSLSGKSRLTYEVACSSEAGDDLALRIASNTGGGFFSDEWLPLAAVEKALHSSAALTSTTLHPIFQGKSVNTAGFLLAVLKHEGAIRLQEGKTRLYEVADFEGFMRGLIQPVSAKAPAPRGKAAVPAKKAIQKAARREAPARKA